jgi:mycoredoxin-dependent peroxiredoxin
MAVEVGDIAPDFTLKDPSGQDMSLSSFRGEKNVTVVFYPFTFTGVCEGELCSLRDEISRFDSSSTQLLAISCDSRHSQRVWSEQQGYNFPVLSDFWPHGAVAQAYGVFDDKLGCAVRTTFVIDKQGRVTAKFGTPDLATPRSQEEYEKALAALP